MLQYHRFNHEYNVLEELAPVDMNLNYYTDYQVNVIIIIMYNALWIIIKFSCHYPFIIIAIEHIPKSGEDTIPVSHSYMQAQLHAT